MSNITPPSGEKPELASPKTTPPSQSAWFDEQELTKVKHLAQKILFKKPEEATAAKVNGALEQVKEYIEKDKELPENVRTANFFLFFRLAKLGPQRWKGVLSQMSDLDIENTDSKQLAQRLKNEMDTVSLPTPSAPQKRSLVAKAAAAPSSDILKQEEKDEPKKKARQEEESQKADPSVIPLAPQKTELPKPAQPNLSLAEWDEKYKKIFNDFYTERRLGKFDWEKLKKEVLAFASVKECRSKSLVHEACWYYLRIQDPMKLQILNDHLKH